MNEVRCTHCRRTYDLGRVETVARYADCTMFKTPCCHRTVDDRRWKTFPDFHSLREEREFEDSLDRARCNIERLGRIDI